MIIKGELADNAVSTAMDLAHAYRDSIALLERITREWDWMMHNALGQDIIEFVAEHTSEHP